MCEYVMLHDKAMYKTKEKIEELTSDVKSLKKVIDDLTKRLAFLEQQQKTPQKSSKWRKQRSRWIVSSRKISYEDDRVKIRFYLLETELMYDALYSAEKTILSLWKIFFYLFYY